MIFGCFFCFLRPPLSHRVWTNSSPWSILKDVIFLDNEVQRFAIEMLENVAIRAVLAHLKSHVLAERWRGSNLSVQEAWTFCGWQNLTEFWHLRYPCNIRVPSSWHSKWSICLSGWISDSSTIENRSSVTVKTRAGRGVIDFHFIKEIRKIFKGKYVSIVQDTHIVCNLPSLTYINYVRCQQWQMMDKSHINIGV